MLLFSASSCGLLSRASSCGLLSRASSCGLLSRASSCSLLSRASSCGLLITIAAFLVACGANEPSVGPSDAGVDAGERDTDATVPDAGAPFAFSKYELSTMPADAVWLYRIPNSDEVWALIHSGARQELIRVSSNAAVTLQSVQLPGTYTGRPHRVAVRDNGDTLFCDTDGSQAQLRFRPDEGRWTTVDLETPGQASFLACMATAQGYVLFGTETCETVGSSRVWTQARTATVGVLGGEVDIDTQDCALYYWGPRVAIQADGSGYYTWLINEVLFGRAFDAAGQPLGDRSLLGPGWAFELWDTDLAGDEYVVTTAGVESIRLQVMTSTGGVAVDTELPLLEDLAPCGPLGRFSTDCTETGDCAVVAISDLNCFADLRAPVPLQWTYGPLGSLDTVPFKTYAESSTRQPPDVALTTNYIWLGWIDVASKRPTVAIARRRP